MAAVRVAAALESVWQAVLERVTDEAFLKYPPVVATIGVVTTTLLFGGVLCNFPQSRLGSAEQRQWGYDVIRGEYSQTAGALFAMFFAYGVVGVLPDLSHFGLLAAIAVLYFLCLWYILGTPTSMPAGPRDNPIEREPEWPDKEWSNGDGWQFASADESHRITESQVDNGQSLTGEAAGRQIWHFTGESKKPGLRSSGRVVGPALFNPSRNPNGSDRLFRRQQVQRWISRGGAAPDEKRPRDAIGAARKGVAFYQMLQCDDGHWAGDYGGPHFLMPGLIVVWYVTGKNEKFLNAGRRRAMQQYLRAHQQTDGGWGTHIESPSTMFGTTLCYVALRLLGAPADDACCARARAFIRGQKGALYSASWAKFYLCLLGVMHWDGHCSVPAEFWMLPDWFPFHPGRLWCHCRMVYLPMSYLYGKRFVYSETETDPVTISLRKELYCEPYDSINWDATRHWVAPMDNYSPKPVTMTIAQDVLAYWERWGGPLRRLVRGWGLDFAIKYMAAEDAQTNYVDIGPVNKVLNMLCAYVEAGGDCPAYQKHILRVPDYLWVAEDGMKMQGYNGSQCWDTSFALQAIVEAGLADEFPELSRKAYRYFERTQILSTKVSRSTLAFKYEDAASRRRFYRHVSEGGWPFSTSAHGWPISDCTSEGLKAMLCMRNLRCITEWKKRPKMTEKRYQNAANVLLTLQNYDGGWATYENNRGYGWYEGLNPSEAFGDIMIDYSYVECTTATLGGLVAFHEAYPKHRTAEIKRSISRGKAFLKRIQRDDGSWYGSWACCFTYAAWFGIEGLVLCGEPKSSKRIRKAIEFLKQNQNDNGGWGEDFTSCFDKQYARRGMERFGDDQGSGVVNTAWALLALTCGGDEQDRKSIERGVLYLMRRQLSTGDWPQEGISGVFNRSCGITYTSYRNVFPIWALGRYAREYKPHYGGTV